MITNIKKNTQKNCGQYYGKWKRKERNAGESGMLLQYTPPKSSTDPERGMLGRNFNNPDHLKELKRDTLGKRIKERQSEKDQIERKGHQSKESQRE